MPQAFKVITGVTQIASSASSKTLTEGTDYTLPAGATAANCFVRLANTRHASIGRNDVNADHNTEDFGVWIDFPTDNITSDMRFNRAGSPAYNCEVRYEILCYVGTGGGVNEFIVREVGSVSGTGQVLTGGTITNITDVGDCVLFITGQGHDDNDSLYWNEMLFSGDLVLNGGNYDPTFSRLEAGQHGTSGATISYAVVEWVGSNWTVDRWTTDSYAGTIWSPGNNNLGSFAHGITIADINKACIIEAHFATSDTPGVTLHCGDALMLYDGTNIRCWRRASSETHRNTAYILQNSQASGTVRNFNCQKVEYQDDSINISDPREITVNLTTNPTVSVNAASIAAPLDETSIVGTCSDDDSGTYYPRGALNYWIAAANEIHYKMNNDDAERRVAFEIIEWPEDESGTVQKSASESVNLSAFGDTETTTRTLSLFEQGILDVEETIIIGKIGWLSDSGDFDATETSTVPSPLAQKSASDSGSLTSVETANLVPVGVTAKSATESANGFTTTESSSVSQLDPTIQKSASDSGAIRVGWELWYRTKYDSLKTGLEDFSNLSAVENSTLIIQGTITFQSSDSAVLTAAEIPNVKRPKSASDTFSLLGSTETAAEISALNYDPAWEDDDVLWGGLQLGSKDFAPIFLNGSFFYLLGRGGGAYLPAFLERRAVIVDRGRALLGRGVYPQILGPSGQTIQISLGGHDSPEGPVDWEGPYDYVIGEDIYVDFAVAGRYLAIRFESENIAPWQLQSYEIDYEVVGVY